MLASTLFIVMVFVTCFCILENAFSLWLFLYSFILQCTKPNFPSISNEVVFGKLLFIHITMMPKHPDLLGQVGHTFPKDKC